MAGSRVSGSWQLGGREATMLVARSGTRSDSVVFRLLVGIWFQVLFHRPHRAAFHLSLTVLVHYRWQWVFSLGSLVEPVSRAVVERRGTQVEMQRA